MFFVYSLGLYCFKWKFLTNTYFIKVRLLTGVQPWTFSSLNSKANVKSDFFGLAHPEVPRLLSLEWGFAPLLHKKVLFKAVIFTLDNMSGAICNALEDFKIKIFPLNISVVIRFLINCYTLSPLATNPLTQHQWLLSGLSNGLVAFPLGDPKGSSELPHPHLHSSLYCCAFCIY